MIEMRVTGLTIDAKTKTPIAILREVDGDSMLPIWVGAMEAMTISLELNKERLPRPMTHDLLLLCLGAAKAGIDHVEITAIKDGIYYAMLVLHCQAHKRAYVDCRPSDAIALALRAGVSILVSREVLSHDEDNGADTAGASAGQIVPDAATAMLRNAGARREMDQINGILSRKGGMLNENDPATEKRLRELLKSIDPVIRQKM